MGDREVFLREGAECRALQNPESFLYRPLGKLYPPHSDVKGDPPKEELYLRVSEPLFLSSAGGVGMDNLLY